MYKYKLIKNHFMKKLHTLSIALLTFVLLNSAFGQSEAIKPTIANKAVYYDLSPLLRDMPVISGKIEKDEDENEDEVANELNLKASRSLQENPIRNIVDPVLQIMERDNIPAAKAPIQNFDGINNTYGVYPPDTQGDVGPNHYVQVVNLGFQVFSKTGTSLYGPANLSTIWAGIPSPWNGTNNGDPIVLYDQAADRWMIAQFSLPNTTQYAMLIAISQTPDPTGAWHRYVFQFGSKMPDYPKFGVWSDGYYMAVNQFISGSSWGGVGACAFERNKMLTGDPTAQMVYFDLGASSDPGGMLPSDWDGTTPPVSGEPNYFTYFNDWSSATDDYLKIWQFHVDWTTTTNSTFAESASLVTAPFNSTVCSSGNCVPQPGSSVLLEALSDRLMYRLQYRNFGDHRSMVTNHTVEVDGTGHAGVRWYELRNTGSGWSIYQQGTYAPDASHRWMGSVAMNGVGDIALGYSVSNGTTIYPSIRYTGRAAGDPLGQMTYAEQTIKDGAGYQSGSAARWGDYSMMSVDPTDDGTFWYTTEYIQSSGSVPWRTRIASFIFGPVPPVAIFTASQTKPCLNNTVIFTDQSSGIPLTWTWAITPATFTYTDGTNAASQNPHVKFTAYGNYTIALTSTNAQGSNTITKTNYISVNAANADFTANLTTIVVGNSTTYTDASTCGISSWLWNFGSGATPATANTQGPHTVSYSTTGQKTVTLTVNGAVTETKTNYVLVTDPIFNMANGTVTTCTGDFYDSGGSSGAYLDNENYTETFYPSTPGNMVRFTFNSFSTESGYDYLRIYNGTSTSAPLIGTYNGTTGPGIITASNASGALTFNFTSDGSVTSSGWSATISCYNAAIPPVAQFTASTTSTTVNSTVTFTDQSTNIPTSWAWSFSPNTVVYTGGTSATSQNPQVQFTALGSYTVTLVATNSYGSDSEIKSGYITVSNCTYCTTSYSNLTDDYISNVTLNTINNTSGSTTYSDYSAINTTLTQGTTSNISASITVNGPWVQHCIAWIDWNNNCSFADAGETFDLGQTPGTAGTFVLSGTVTVPESAVIGSTRMRVSEQYSQNPGSCDVATYGEAEDYTVIVQATSKTLNLTLFLEGLFNGTTMNKAKNSSGDQYAGTVADQVSIELHNSTAPYALVGGPFTVNVNTDGTATANIPASLGASYYVVIKHRNSLETWNGSPISFGGASVSYNFSSGASQAYGSNMKLVSGKYVIYSGDVNQDGMIDSDDLIPVDNAAASFLTGYLPTDVNGDGLVNSTDISIINANSAIFIGKITP